MTQRPEITFEYEKTVILKQGGKLITEFCPRCRATVDMLSPDVLSLVSSISEREIFQLVEKRLIHFKESNQKVVCRLCLQKNLDKGPLLAKASLRGAPIEGSDANG